jgi:hypothetical protein
MISVILNLVNPRCLLLPNVLPGAYANGILNIFRTVDPLLRVLIVLKNGLQVRNI